MQMSDRYSDQDIADIISFLVDEYFLVPDPIRAGFSAVKFFAYREERDGVRGMCICAYRIEDMRPGGPGPLVDRFVSTEPFLTKEYEILSRSEIFDAWDACFNEVYHELHEKLPPLVTDDEWAAYRKWDKQRLADLIKRKPSIAKLVHSN